MHNYCGIQTGEGDVKSLEKKVKRNKKALQRWQRIAVLIIDESRYTLYRDTFTNPIIVSMISGELFDKLSELAYIFRNRKPFGGIQVILRLYS